MQSGTMRLWRVVSLVFAALTTSAWAQFDQPAVDEGATRADTSGALSMQGDRSFGDMVDLYTGSLSFSQTDVSIPGNSALPVAITRRFDTTRTRSLFSSASTLAFYDWQLDIPRITVTVANLAPWPTNRCSGSWVPPTVRVGEYYYYPDEYSAGFKLEFPGGSTEMLGASNVLPRPSAFTRVAKGNIGISCTTATEANGANAGEGFIVWMPDGTRYDMTLHTSAQATNVKYLTEGEGAHGKPILARHTDSLLATRATDRFGNTVDYTYDSAGKLTRIASNDGRIISIYWKTYNTSPVIDYVTDGVRRWTYGYANDELTAVTRPDGSQWRFNLAALAVVKPGAPNPYPLGLVGSMTTPYGLSGTFTLGIVYHGYARVPVYGTPVYFPTASLLSKQISGPGVPSQIWNYGYNGGGGWWANVGTPGSETKSIDVIDPMGVVTRSTYNVNFDWREGQLERTDVFPAGSSTPIQSTTYTYIQVPPIGGGSILGLSVNYGRYGEPRRMTSTTTQVNGDTFTTQIDAVDAYKNPTQMTTSNSLSSVVRTATMSYINNSDVTLPSAPPPPDPGPSPDPTPPPCQPRICSPNLASSATGSPWVIGVPTSMTINGTQVSQTTLNAQFQPQDRTAYGLFQSHSEYYPNGLLQSQRDGLSHTSTMSDYYRGKPQTMTRPDSNALRMTVNPTGTIASMTDARGNTTSMGYDLLNRPSAMAYPTGDTVAWSGQTVGYTTLAAPELGMPSGAFRARSSLGRQQISTYYDAELRPMLVEEKDTVTGIATYRRTTYDPMGRVSFQSYPSATPDAPSGVVSTYDAFGRLIRTGTTEGKTLQTIAYFSGNRMQVTDASSNRTLTSYQAFGAPSYDKPIRIEAAGQTTVINRNVFGDPLSVTQGSVTRTNVYDSYHRLCKTIEPETGQTVMAFDADSKLTWSAKGFSGNPAACDNATRPATAIGYSYDVLDRMTGVDYADASGDVSLSYDLDGHLTRATNPTARWSYTWNKRGLLETQQAVIDGKTFLIDPAYNGLGQLSSLSYPDGRSYAYGLMPSADRRGSVIRRPASSTGPTA